MRIVKYGNISKAAESLFVSQPSLTKYLQRLEQELQVELIDRKQNPLRLTDAGQCFYDYVSQVTAQKKTLLAQISEIRSAERATLTIGMPLWRANVLLPAFLPGFSARHPLIKINLIEGRAVELEQAIINETVDLSVMNLPVTYANIFYTPILEEHIFLVGSRKSSIIRRLTGGQFHAPPIHVDIRALAQHPFILTQPGQHITDFVDRMLSRNNVELNCIFRTANVSTAVNLAAAGIGFTFVPETGTTSQFFPREDVALLTVDDPPLHCTLAAVYKRSKYLSAAAQTFIQELQQFCTEKMRTLPNKDSENMHTIFNDPYQFVKGD